MTYNGGRDDAYLRSYDPKGHLLYSTLLGGSDHEFARYVAVDASGNAVVAGDVSSADFPTTPEAYDPTFNGGGDVFVTKFEISK